MSEKPVTVTIAMNKSGNYLFVNEFDISNMVRSFTVDYEGINSIPEVTIKLKPDVLVTVLAKTKINMSVDG